MKTIEDVRAVDFHGYTICEDGTIYGLHGRKLKQRLHDGRYEIRLVINGERKNFIVARLVYFVFIGFDIDNVNLCIVPKDDDKLNIHIDNLYMEERKDLIQGSKHKKIAKITDEQAEEIRSLYKGKAGGNQYDKSSPSLKDLADRYGVTKSNIAHIIKDKSRSKEHYKLK